jgi:hypothetical protein
MTAGGFDRQATLIRQLQGIIRRGTGSPQSVVTAPVGCIYLRNDGGAGSTLYVKESGTGNTGWVAK